MADSARSGDIIVVKDFSFRYPSAPNYVLKDINISVRRGEFLSVMGPTGAGKTTFCLALNGVVPHFYGGDFYGSVSVAGLDTVSHPTYEMAQHVGMVFQDPEIQLTAPTVSGEIAFALENLCIPVDEIKRRIPEALAAVRLDGMEDRHPHQLSGGQKQRLAIAAALALRPDVLVLDEPTSQLDPVGTDEVFAVVRELNRSQGITIILVSHAAEEVAEYADRVMLLAGGELLAESAPSVFFQNLDLLREHDVRPPEITSAFEALLPGPGRAEPLPVTLRKALAQFEALKPRVDLQPSHGPDGAPAAAQGEVVLQTCALHYRYPTGTHALQGISLDIRKGEYVAIVGQNGAGKSTLVRHFLHLISPSEGQVSILGKDVATYSTSGLAQHIGYVSQNPDNQIFCDSVRKEVEFALVNLKFSKAEIAARASAALREMKLEWAVDHHPLTLSKGDRSRIVIAAILAMNPGILIFDEPTTGQDYKGARAILDLTRELHQAGRTVVIITHHLYLLPGYAERLIVMGQGQALLDTSLREGFYATEALRQTYLTPPQVVQFAEAAWPAGAPAAKPLTAAELVAAVRVH
jgi:energy-coupling factor transporter ATP-binding protein EcfA2